VRSGISGTNEQSETEEPRRGFKKLEAKKFRHLRFVDQDETDDLYVATASVAAEVGQTSQVEMSFMSGGPEEGTSSIDRAKRIRTNTEG
jgi:hypothetical protein